MAFIEYRFGDLIPDLAPVDGVSLSNKAVAARGTIPNPSALAAATSRIIPISLALPCSAGPVVPIVYDFPAPDCP
jgi:hypothetical protein